ncbi:MAG: DNA polymerase III subunit chi [Rhodobacteraceae bacterium]|jgi:DNA polymerase-3 subunit chi|uniref:DNA polymerase III subunit chi n=1 Tax=Albidovulum sp. TaxID=1872424 RepID=UPI001D21DE59|nr:DNA polymerase III subunit chi [uncultured Defluviimonas sp.]MCB2124231.1 DNA polymerase III subunit chi [Paracoccaceae bacterium]MCC0068601.1 DNA polymerase III subunit chi [Paracoccaceae bacterium]
MGQAMFYHLTRSPLEAALPMLLARSLESGWHVVVRGTDAGRLDWLDQRLWTAGEESFLPHGLSGGPHDALQPILLTAGREAPNGAQCLMALDGAEVSPEEGLALTRVCVLFDGNDPAAVDHARGQWKSLTAAGVPAQYWSEESGRWQKKAESGGGAAG